MYEKYAKENNIEENTIEQKNTQLLKSLITARIELENANKNFEYAQGGLIDYYSYQIKANKAKIDYLLRQIKNEGLVLDMIEQMELENLSQWDAV